MWSMHYEIYFYRWCNFGFIVSGKLSITLLLDKSICFVSEWLISQKVEICMTIKTSFYVLNFTLFSPQHVCDAVHEINCNWSVKSLVSSDYCCTKVYNTRQCITHDKGAFVQWALAEPYLIEIFCLESVSTEKSPFLLIKNTSIKY